MWANDPPLNRILQVALADFRQRVRSRRLLVVLAVIAYIGYQLNVGAFELLYLDEVNGEMINYRGEPTAAYVGLTTGVTGATVLLMFGYYILSGSITRDRSTGVDQLVASTSVTDRSYLLGKWLSHVGIVAILLVTLGVAALINHLIHGTGTTDPLWILGATLLIGLPLGCFVAAITLLFQSTDTLNGTLGNVTYLFAALVFISAFLTLAHEQESETVPLWLRLSDTVGLFVAGELTFDALLDVAPEYSGPVVANYGQGAESGELVTYHWNGEPFPGWFYANRLGFVLLGLGLVLLSTLPYDRYDSDNESKTTTLVDRFTGALPALSVGRSSTSSEVESPTTATLTPVTDRNSAEIGRLIVQELRLMVRNQPWWWYVGAIAIGVAGLASPSTSEALIAIAAVWPLFLLSEMGYRTTHHRMTPLIISSKHPYGQLFAEWAAGAVVTASFLGVVLWPTFGGGAGAVVVFAGAVLFAPSLAQLLGLWSNTRRTFELIYLVIWYVGPLNGVVTLDFAGATLETAGTLIPLLFGAVGVASLFGAFVHRYQQT